MKLKRRFKILHLPDKYEENWTIAEIWGEVYAVIGNGGLFKRHQIVRDWGKGTKWGRPIKISK